MPCGPKSLDAKTAELLAVAAAASTGADKCLKVHMAAASQAGASEDEILDAVFIAAIIGQSKSPGLGAADFSGIR